MIRLKSGFIEVRRVGAGGVLMRVGGEVMG